MNRDLLQRLQSCKTLPALPTLPVRILKICREEQGDATLLAELIGQDPAITAKVLAVSNSAYYGGVRHNVTSLLQAVTLLGMNAVGTLAFSFCLFKINRNTDGESVR